MNVLDLAALALGLGVGGVGGALAATLVAGSRLSTSWSMLAEAYRSFRASRTTLSEQVLEDSFAEHEAAVAGFTHTVAKLKRLLRLK